MKYINLKMRYVIIAAAAVSLLACKKTGSTDPVGNAGQTIVKILNAGLETAPGSKIYSIDFVPNPVTLIGADIRRDAPSDAEYDKAVTVTIKDDTGLVSRNGYKILNPAWYTISSPGVTKTGGLGGTYTVTFSSGEFAKPISITIPDATVLDPSFTYALGFKVVSTSYGVLLPEVSYLMVVGAKNKYDGRYNMKGYHNRSPYTFPYDEEMYMVTVGGASVRFFWPEVNAFGHPIGVGPGNDLNWYGPGIGPVVVFDPATDLVTDVFNAGGSTVITMFTGAGAGVSRYEASTKTIYVSWNYANNPLRAFFDTLTYIGPRP